MIQYRISCPNPASQFLQIELRFSCTPNEKVQLQLPAWRAGRYQIANYAQNLRGFTASNSKGESLPFAKTTKDSWELIVPDDTQIHINYEYWAGKMDAGSAWVDDQQVYINLVNCCFELLGRSTETIAVQLVLEGYPHRAVTLIQTEASTWMAENYQILADATVLAAKKLHCETYTVGITKFQVWFHGDIHFDNTWFVNQLQAFTIRMMEDFGSFPEPEYQFIFQLLPYPHYHGVEHRRGTVITFGPATSLNEAEALEELLGISCHELYHAWNVCRIRPKEFLPYDFSKETYTQAGLVLEGVTTYFGDLYLLKSGAYDLLTYLSHLEKIVQREAAHFGWKNASIEESSIDLWLDGYVLGVPDRKVNIYSHGALICLCLDVQLLKEGSSLAQVMNGMWENFGLPFKGYDLTDFEKEIAVQSAEPEKIRQFFDSFVRGREDLFPILEDCIQALGIFIRRDETETPVFNQIGIQVTAQQVIQKIHPESIAYKHLMANDLLLTIDLNPDTLHWDLEVVRQGRSLILSFAKEAQNFYPQMRLEAGPSTPLRNNWMY
jgi:predicted metalloprotease with PDZ domain